MRNTSTNIQNIASINIILNDLIILKIILSSIQYLFLYLNAYLEKILHREKKMYAKNGNFCKLELYIETATTLN